METIRNNIVKRTVITAIDARIEAAAKRNDLEAEALLQEYKKVKDMDYLQYVNKKQIILYNKL